MGKRAALGALTFALFFGFGRCWALETGWLGLAPVLAFPDSSEYYTALLADPTELGYGGRYVLPLGGDRFGEVMIGDYIGVFRWAGLHDQHVQLNLGGGAIGRFNLSTPRNNLEVVDFTGTIPVDFNWGRHTIRTGVWHTSSHLGDDYIDRVHPSQLKRATDSFRAIYSYALKRRLRVYGGGSYAFNRVNQRGRRVIQTGVEVFSRPLFGRFGQVFLAQDLQSHERIAWNPSYSVRTGLRIADTKKIAAATMFIEYFSGHQYFIQFYTTRETRWSFGLTFEIGTPVKTE